MCETKRIGRDVIIDLVEVEENSYIRIKREVATLAWSNTHKGETAIVIGHGKSLDDVPRNMLKKYPSFGVNHIYLLPFQPTYYFCYDSYIMRNYPKRIHDTASKAKIAFLSDKFFDEDVDGLEELYNLKNVYLCNNRTVIFPYETLMGGSTVTYVALKVAYVMGFSTILLVGCDRDSKMEHFGEDYPVAQLKNTKTEQQEEHLKLAGDVYKVAGRRIINLSLPSVLDEYFERGRMDDYT